MVGGRQILHGIMTIPAITSLQGSSADPSARSFVTSGCKPSISGVSLNNMIRIIATVAFILTVAPALADSAEAWETLRTGGHVALMRHADAPGGAGDPPGF